MFFIVFRLFLTFHRVPGYAKLIFFTIFAYFLYSIKELTNGEIFSKILRA